MKNIVIISLGVVVSLLFQTTLLSHLSLKPDGVVALTLAVAFLRGPIDGALTGFFGGLAADALSGISGGSFCLTMLITGWFFGVLVKRFYSNNVLVLFVAALLGNIFYLFIFRVLGTILGWGQAASYLQNPWGWLFLQGILCVLFLFLFKGWIGSEVLD